MVHFDYFHYYLPLRHIRFVAFRAKIAPSSLFVSIVSHWSRPTVQFDRRFPHIFRQLDLTVTIPIAYLRIVLVRRTRLPTCLCFQSITDHRPFTVARYPERRCRAEMEAGKPESEQSGKNTKND